MSWMLWVVVGWFAFSALTLVAGVGEPRKPLTGKSAAVGVAVVAGLVVLIILGGACMNPWELVWIILGWLVVGTIVFAVGVIVLGVIIAGVKAIRKPKRESSTQVISSAPGVEVRGKR